MPNFTHNNNEKVSLLMSMRISYICHDISSAFECAYLVCVCVCVCVQPGEPV